MADFTKRDFLKGIVEGAVVTAEQAAFAAKEIEALDKRNEKRKATPSKTAIANEPIKKAIVEFLEGKGPTPASALARQLVEAGELTVGETKIPKKGAVKVYALAPVVEVELDEGAEEA